jgi:hypothetical protein
MQAAGAVEERLDQALPVLAIGVPTAGRSAGQSQGRTARRRGGLYFARALCVSTRASGCCAVTLSSFALSGVIGSSS